MRMVAVAPFVSKLKLSVVFCHARNQTAKITNTPKVQICILKNVQLV